MILVTGGTGFIGQNLVRDLLNEGYPARLLCRDIEKARKMFPKIEAVKGDILDKESIRKAVKDAGTIIHLAGVISYTMPREELFRINLQGTKNLLEASKNASKFIFSSSVSVYGSTKGVADEATPARPRNFYGQSKLAAETAVLESGIPSVCNRISVVYGVGSPIWWKIMKFFGKGFPIPKANTNTNLIHVSDVSRAFIIGLEKGKGVYNIAGNENIPFINLANMLASEIGIEPKFWPVWLVKLLAGLKGKGKDMDAFILNREYRIEKARKELGFSPRMPIEEGIKEMVGWYKSGANP
ncbi:MAG: NAD-dependent epimerase/dehydratase family protein [Candidatus Aenigmarchaeota archaeon]|nr:NAD-dependent epimerase/dehydratase family protein [Candidatus Aenigmarchaeota archaeon]